MNWAFKNYAHELQWWTTVFEWTTATGNRSQRELEAICSKIKLGFRCSSVSHFTRHMGLHLSLAKVRNETKSHLIPKTEQTNPLFTHEVRTERAESSCTALLTSSSDVYAAPSSSMSSAMLSTIADAPLDAASGVGSLTTCAFLLSTPSHALSTAWRI